MHFTIILVSTAALAGLSFSSPFNSPATDNANGLDSRQMIPPSFGGPCPKDGGDCCFGIDEYHPKDCRQCSSGQRCCNTARGHAPSGSDTPPDSCAQYS